MSDNLSDNPGDIHGGSATAAMAPDSAARRTRWVRAGIAGAVIGIVAVVGIAVIGVGADHKSCACADPRVDAAGVRVAVSPTVPPTPTATVLPTPTATPTPTAAPASVDASAVPAPGSPPIVSPPPTTPVGPVISRTITVSGQGKTTVKPDTATVQLGVSVQRSTASAALDQANRSAATLITALKQAGVADDDITTTGLNIWPRYDNGSTIDGYTATNSVSVTVRDITRTGPVVDAAAAAAGDDISISGVSFSVGDPEQVMAAARTDAIQNAQKRAGEFADAAGVKVGAVLQISETSSTPYEPRIYAADSVATTVAGAAAPTPIQTGTTELDVTVTVVYAIG
jgi:uncharacterized protein YggE